MIKASVVDSARKRQLAVAEFAEERRLAVPASEDTKRLSDRSQPAGRQPAAKPA